MPVYNTQNKKVVDYLRQLQLSTDEVAIYLYLLQAGPQTVLHISRGLKTGRTKLYPILESLAYKQLIASNERHYGTSYQATNPETLGLLVASQEQLSSSLRSGLPATLHALQEMRHNSPATSKIIEYPGLEAAKQVYWNLKDAETDYFILELPVISKQIGKHLKTKLQSVLAKKQITGNVLTNQKNPAAPARYIDNKIFNIEFETYTYNNVVSLITFEKDACYGLEIHSPQYAHQYKKLLSALCVQATR